MEAYHCIEDAIARVVGKLMVHGLKVEHQRWQGLDLEDRGPEWHHWEILNANFVTPMPETIEGLAVQTQANLPWAEDQFQERVSGEPLNPGNTYMHWPHWTPASEAVLDANGQFTHTYMERFWPKQAGRPQGPYEYTDAGNRGIRYTMGDLSDVVEQLLRDPYTRQAYLPIFFPEDTGAVHGGRVPCTLGYHFMMRRNRLHLWYEIRSCDLLRHFRDDVYMAVRLAQWMLRRLRGEEQIRNERDPGEPPWIWCDVELGGFTFLAHSMHVFMGDRHAL